MSLVHAAVSGLRSGDGRAMMDSFDLCDWYGDLKEDGLGVVVVVVTGNEDSARVISARLTLSE